jgi:hypothetical protein
VKQSCISVGTTWLIWWRGCYRGREGSRSTGRLHLSTLQVCYGTDSKILLLKGLKKSEIFFKSFFYLKIPLGPVMHILIIFCFLHFLKNCWIKKKIFKFYRYSVGCKKYRTNYALIRELGSFGSMLRAATFCGAGTGAERNSFGSATLFWIQMTLQT